MDRRQSKRQEVKIFLSSVKSGEMVWELNLVVENAYIEVEGPRGDIGEGGIFIPFDVPELTEGERVLLRFTLPEMVDLFEVEGEVVWKGEKNREIKGFGIKFLNLPAEFRSHIKELMGKNEKS